MVKRNIGPGWAPHFAGQQRGHFKGTALAFDETDHIAKIKDQAGNETIAKAVMSTTDGSLEIHLIDDWNSSGQPVWLIIDLVGGSPAYPALFDAVRETGTTVETENLEFIL
jgi:hypothetical protein